MDAAPRSPDAGRNAGIDLLRGFSILLVVLHHIGLRIPLRKTALLDVLPKKLLAALNFNGYEAVFIFFVISGFLITSNALRRSGSLADVDLRAFYARRFSRIAPCLLLLVAVLSMLHLAGVPDYVIDREGQSLPRAVVAALGFHLNWYEGMTGYLPGNWDVLWSLSIEEVFYLGFPIACLLTRRTWVLAPMLVVLAISLPWTHAALADNEIWQEKAYLPGMAAIATGVLGALIVQRWRVVPRVAGLLFFTTGIIGLYLVMFEGKLLRQAMHDGYMLLLTGAALALVLASAWSRSTWTSWRGLGWLRSWGWLSYEVYLTHMFVVYGIVRIYKAVGSDIAHGYLWYLPALPMCWLLGKGMERWVSTPAERWLKGRMLRRVSAPVMAQGASL